MLYYSRGQKRIPSQFKKTSVIIIILFFLITYIPISISTQSTSEVIPEDCISQGYMVMDHFIETPPEELSPKPPVTTTGPSAFSWKNYNGKDWTTPAKNQGPCGSCWAFGAVSSLESVINIAWNDPNLDIDLSEQYILSCLSKSGSCGGGNSNSAFKYIMRDDSSGNNCNGIITEDSLYYQADDSVPCHEKSSDWTKKLVPISNYGSWNADYPEDVDRMKSELITRGPLVTYFQATGSFSYWGSTHHSPEDYYPYEKGNGANHAVIILGYKDDPSIDHGGYWICKNSWGTDWGYNGFFNIEYGSLNIDNVEITWVEYEPYPIVDFTFSPKGPKAGESIYFTDQSSCLKGSISSWSWDFGDGTQSTQQYPTKTYAENGAYQLSLTVTDSYGYSDTLTQTMYIGDEQPPTSTYSITGTKGDNDWYLSTIMLKLTATDSFSGVDHIMYSINGASYQQYDRALIISGKTYPGEHTLSYYAVDNSGNTEEIRKATFKLDAIDPEVHIKTPVNNTFYLCSIPLKNGMDETILLGPFIPKVEISDKGSGIEKVYFFFNNRLINVDYTAPYTCIINRFHLGNTCSFSVKVYDKSGRTTESEIRYFTQYSVGLLRNIM